MMEVGFAAPRREPLPQGDVRRRVPERGLIGFDRHIKIAFVVRDLAEEHRRGRQPRLGIERRLEQPRGVMLAPLKVSGGGSAVQQGRILRMRIESISEDPALLYGAAAAA